MLLRVEHRKMPFSFSPHSIWVQGILQLFEKLATGQIELTARKLTL
jgi:hypothetical protein